MKKIIQIYNGDGKKKTFKISKINYNCNLNISLVFHIDFFQLITNLFIMKFSIFHIK